jgi:LuxR family transcriptional regulator, maltose regulon positive regulatory protein
MDTDQLWSKIQMPTLPTPILHREALVSMITKAIQPSGPNRVSPYRFMLLCAPAGYGKTTLLVDTLQKLALTSCWYFCDYTDTPYLFLTAFISSLRQHFPDFGARLEQFLALDNPDAETPENCELLLEALLGALQTEISQHFVMALCNYQKVNQNKTINHLVNRLLARFPQRGTLVIESRSLPNLELASLIAHRQLFGLGSGILSFSAQELHDLAHLQGFTDLALQEAEHLTNAFEGWIAGILLESGLGYTRMEPLAPAHKRKWGARALLSDRQQLSNYITSEVFSQETASYEFLKAVSIFDQLIPEYCDELLEINDTAERLIYAEQQGLLVVRSEELATQDRSGAYICHPILREILRESLQKQAFGRYLELHRRAAQILQKHREYEQALTHALLAQEYSLAISIMQPIAPDLIEQGEGKTVARWLALLPEHIVQQDPWLLLLQANIYLARNEYTQVQPLLNTVESLLENVSPEQDRSRFLLLPIELRLARSKFLFYQGDFQTARELCQEALILLPVDELYLRMRVHHRLGVCFIVGNGYIHEGILQLQHALQLSSTQKNDRQTATLCRLLASAYSWMGNYVLADYHQMRALQTWEKLNEPWGITNSLTSMGLLKLRQGSTTEAEEVLLKALHMAQTIYHFTSGEAYALVALGECYCNMAQYMKALPYLEEGLHLAYECKDRYLINCSLCSMATTYLFIGEIQTSQFFLQQVVLKAEAGQSYEELLYRLTQGRISLAQQAYDAAQQELEQGLILARRTNIQFLYMRVLILLAVCFLRQQKISETNQFIEQAMSLNKKGNYAYDLKVELSCYPELQEHLDQVHQEPSSVSSPAIQRGLQPPVTRLQILAFGDPEVLIDGVPVTRWHMTRSLELFFFLLEKSHPVQKDQMIDALWPNATSDQIDTTMRTAIYYLRKAINKTCIVYRSGLYSLDLAAVYGKQIGYDISLFEESYSRAKKALKEQNDEVAGKAFTDMLVLYKGDYLQPFYNDWCSSRRDQLRQAHMDAHQQLALIALRRENWEESLKHWQYLLNRDICSEEAHYGIIYCYFQQGKRSLALKQYQDCCQILDEELQIKPGPFIQKLYQKII